MTIGKAGNFGSKTNKSGGLHAAARRANRISFISMGGDRIRRVIILELQEEDGEVFEDFLSFLQDHPEIENCKQNKDSIISLPGLEIYPRQRRVYRNEQEIPLMS